MTDTQHVKDLVFTPKKDWVAFFSHTGSEIVNLSNKLGITPSRIVTNLEPGDDRIDSRLLDLKTEIVYVSNRPDVSDYERVLNRCDDCMCTLHGWMRIVPEDICNNYEMWNLHPGLINMYPELKGADPQWRVDPDKHEWIGLVIHKVEPGVDEGSIAMSSKKHNTFANGDIIAKELHEMALSAWTDFFHLCLSE